MDSPIPIPPKEYDGVQVILSPVVVPVPQNQTMDSQGQGHGHDRQYRRTSELGSGSRSGYQIGDHFVSANGIRFGNTFYDFEPGTLPCYRCEQTVCPEMDAYPTTKTHLIAAFLGCIGLAFLMYLPYMMNCFTKPIVRCPLCGAYLSEPLGVPLKEPVPLD